MSLQRRIVTSHESPSRSSSPPPLSSSSRRTLGSKNEYASLPNDYPSGIKPSTTAASRKRVLFILGPILFILFIIHLLSNNGNGSNDGSLGKSGHHLPGFGAPRSSASRRTDRINAARQRQKSAASGELFAFSILLELVSERWE